METTSIKEINQFRSVVDVNQVSVKVEPLSLDNIVDVKKPEYEQTAPSSSNPTNNHLAAQNLNAASQGSDPSKESNQEILAQAIQKAQAKSQELGRELSFSLNKEIGKVVVTVSDPQTGKVVRQIPSDAFIKLAERMEANKSMLLDSKA
ncbi:MAG: flagellar protein FlaG [Gammaproteobacteria bacterium]|nr:flagellar protein FlaG [Gammaproteobacteria bacterium]MDH5728323.1 flagellar protein FlaG [Gammaproteobacteria bacterium]